MPLQTNCATFEGRREPRRRVRRILNRTSRDRRSRGSRLVRLFRPQNCGAVAHALAGTGRVEDDPKLSRFYNAFYLQGDRSTTYAERAADCKLAAAGGRPDATRQLADGPAEEGACATALCGGNHGSGGPPGSWRWPPGATVSYRWLPTPTSRTSSGPTTRRAATGYGAEMLREIGSSWSGLGRSGSSARGGDYARS